MQHLTGFFSYNFGFTSLENMFMRAIKVNVWQSVRALFLKRTILLCLFSLLSFLHVLIALRQ